MRGPLLSDEEKELIRLRHREHVSYSWIARELNERFSLYNGGTRTKATIKSFIRTDSGMLVRQVQIPMPLAELAANSGVDLSPETLSSLLTDALKRRVGASVSAQTWILHPGKFAGK